MSKIILGIDPGSLRTGWGVIERTGTRLSGIDAGVIQLDSEASLALRLCKIHESLASVITQYKPHEVAIEDIFYARNAQAALKLGHARGVALLAAAQTGLPVFAYLPTAIKRAVGSRGRADKAQVAAMVGALVGFRQLPVGDATDALAVAIAHAHAAQVPGTMAAKRTRRRSLPPRFQALLQSK